MEKKRMQLIPNIKPRIWHGSDYFPEQWLSDPDIFRQDIELMKKAHCNVMSIGMFAWSQLEREEGVFTFEWLDHVLDEFEKNGIYTFLATPSGARPAWLSQKYPEVLRVNANRVRNLHGARHNHCFTSPVYREKVAQINEKLAERYAKHPAVIAWHVSNEYGGECHCDHCQSAFREWLKNKYQTLDQLNHAWWTTFWSHTYTDWSQVESPAPHGESAVHGHNLDWRRFVSDQTIDFYKHEIKPLKAANSDIPVFTNFMNVLGYTDLNHAKFAEVVDFVSWDSYPTWHAQTDERELAASIAFHHDMYRSLKNGQPFLLMESTPSTTNWQGVSKLKRPGMHALSSLQAVAHGSDSVQYFQWRKSRGSSEKFHGAVVDHVGHENTRVFRDVEQLGDTLEKLSDVAGTTVDAKVAIIFDTENRWAINDAQGPRNIGVKYESTVLDHYQAFWDAGVSVDIIDMEKDISNYKLVIAPMLYMIKPGVGKQIEQFVEAGGTFVATYWSGIVDENDLVVQGGFPGSLRKTLGIWSEEIDGLYDDQTQTIKVTSEAGKHFSDTYTAHEICDLIHLETAEALASYGEDFYAGRPALTVNQLGSGRAYYIASRNQGPFHKDFYNQMISDLEIDKVIDTDLPIGVTAQARTDGKHDYVFIMNFTTDTQNLNIPNKAFIDIENNAPLSGDIELSPYEVRLLKRKVK